jgi:predicted PP-loop superfamily ATPase
MRRRQDLDRETPGQIRIGIATSGNDSPAKDIISALIGHTVCHRNGRLANR